MSHLHIPDGFLPLPLCAGGYLACALLLFLAVRQIRRRGLGEALSRIGTVSALMLLVMSVPLGPLPVHLNLAVLSGIILGPWSGIISMFIVNLILALAGHGGISVLGLNASLIIVEMLLGYSLFRALSKIARPGRAAAASAAIALACSLAVTVSVLSLVHIDPVEAFVHEDAHHASHHDADATEPSHNGATTALATIVPLSLASIAAESLVVAGVVGYLYKVRPDLIGMG